MIQGALNRISRNYPAIPKISQLDGLFGPSTEDAVRAFQRIFNLNPDGIVGPSTWYQLQAIYVAVTKLAELQSEGQRYLTSSYELPRVLSLGSSGEYVSKLQYLLQILGDFIPEIPALTIDGQYGVTTRDAVLAYQRYAGLTPSGLVGEATWDSIINRVNGIDNTILQSETLFPDQSAQSAIVTIADVQRSLQTVAPVFATLSPPRVTGMMDRSTTRAIAKLQNQLKLRPTGQLDADTRRNLETLASAQLDTTYVRHRQYPGRAIYLGQRDDAANGKEGTGL